MSFGVAADQPHQRDRTPQRGDVAGDITGTPQHLELVGPHQDRDRGLGRDPTDPAIDEAINHQIANAGDTLAGDLAQEVLQGDQIHALACASRRRAGQAACTARWTAFSCFSKPAAAVSGSALGPSHSALSGSG